jgi:hypothetical protein
MPKNIFAKIYCVPMAKYLLTPEGMAALHAGLYSHEDEHLRQEAAALSEDSLSWIAEHFELTVTQLEFLRNAGPGLMASLGYSIALAIIARRPFVIIGLCNSQDGIQDSVAATATIHCTLNFRYTTGGLDSDGEVRANLASYKPGE